jgi:D-lactate dehydrogenase (cytochrome)
VKELGLDTIDVMRSLKRALDPHWLMNPGKIFDATNTETPSGSAQATAVSLLERPKKQ